ncbi:MAG: hypothetical protein ACM31G_09425, partial [Flavobacteriales bacterium]
ILKVMGGEGSMAAANSSLKLNRSQLAKRKERKVLEGSYANLEMKDFPKASPEQLKLIKEKIQSENRQNRTKQILLLTISMFLLILLLIFIT